MFRIVVCTGGRNFSDRKLFETIMGLYVTAESVVFVGDCPTGLDRMAREYCERHGIRCHVYRADWKRFGRAAGPRRNNEMCYRAAEAAYRAEVPVQLIAFPGGRGTASCVREAHRYNIPSMIMHPRQV